MHDPRCPREIETLARLSIVINSSLDIVEVLNTSMGVVEELMNAEATSIFEIDFDRNDLFFRLARGGGGGVKETRMKMGEGVAGWVASSGDPLLVPDAAKDSHFSEKVDRKTGFRTRSILAVPIVNQGRIIGVLEVLNKKGPRSFDDEDVRVLTIVAGQIGNAMENARLYSRLKEKFALTQAELKASEAKLIRSERLAALGQLSQGVAHAVRNPVMSIGGFARRLKNCDNDKSLHDYADLILSETSRLERIVKNVTQYTSMTEPVPKQIRISKLLAKTLAQWREHYDRATVQIQTKINPEDPLITVDEDLMITALIHLLRNASEAMPDGGDISIATQWENTWLVISVLDHGTGITPQNLPLVFDPFFTTKTYGSGLGLTTVNRIVSGHGGEVKLLSAPGHGTEARIYLPSHRVGEYD